jgi:hypothetical protein
MMAEQSSRLVLGRTLFGMIGLLFGLALLAGGARVFWLSRFGQVTQGRVVSKRQIRTSGKNRAASTSDYLVTYSFRTKEGKSGAGEDKVGPEFWTSLKAGDPITVAYVPSFRWVNWQGDLPDPTAKGFADFAMALGTAMIAWGVFKIAKRSRPVPAGIHAQSTQVTTDDVGLPTLKAQRTSRSLIEGLIVMTAGLLMAGYSFGPRWLAGTQLLGVDPVSDTLGLSGSVLAVLGFPITIIAALFGSGLSKKRLWVGLAVGLALMAVSGGWIAYHFHDKPSSGRLVGAEAVLVVLAVYAWMIGVAIMFAASSYGVAIGVRRRVIEEAASRGKDLSSSRPFSGRG